MKKGLAWLAIFALMSTLIIGTVTGFTFSKLDIQLHDTYYVVKAIDAIKALTLIFFLTRGLYLLTDIMTDRYKVLALLISIINAIAGLFVVIAAYMSTEAIFTTRKMYSYAGSSAHFLLPAIFIGIFVVQIIVEIRMIRKLRGLLAGA
jgi:heme/copper-type cytochrome/quinol oxidase subunit 1